MSNSRWAVIFPGQGSQALGMMSEWRADKNYGHIIEQTFHQASDVLDLDMWAFIQDDRLHETQFTQPIVLTASIALWRVLNVALAIVPNYLAGHSLGEYSALVAADVIAFEDALQIVYERGRFMSEAVLDIETQMSAVLGLADEQIIALCERVSRTQGVVNPANFNSAGQVVIAGVASAVQAVMAEAQVLGAKCIPLKVSVPSHCALMQSASDQLAMRLHETSFAKPKIAVIQNVNACVLDEAKEIKDALIAQLSMPVQWTATMQYLANQKIEALIECGYGGVLSNLAKRQNIPLPAFSIDKPEKLTKLLERINES